MSRIYSAETVNVLPWSEANIPVVVAWPTLHPVPSIWLVEPEDVSDEF